MLQTTELDAGTLNRFAPGYANTFISHCANTFDWQPGFAARVVTNALRFLSLCAIAPTGAEAVSETRVMVSSPTVDKVVDTIMLDTPLLMWLEERFGGRRLIHVPAYAHKNMDKALAGIHYDWTRQLMQAAGYVLDINIWPPSLPIDYAVCIAGGGIPPCHMKRAA